MATAAVKIMDYWSCPEHQLLDSLSCSKEGLTGQEAGKRLKARGHNAIRPDARTSSLLLLLRQFKSPVTLILIAASILSLFLGQRTDALIILVIIFTGAALGFYQERGAAQAFRRLLQLVQVKVLVIREREEKQIPVEEVVPGDIVLLKAINLRDEDDPQVFRLAYLNAFFETGFCNPIDQAIKNYASPDIADVVKLDELPYDFIRRRLSILVGEVIRGRDDPGHTEHQRQPHRDYPLPFQRRPPGAAAGHVPFRLVPAGQP